MQASTMLFPTYQSCGTSLSYGLLLQSSPWEVTQLGDAQPIIKIQETREHQKRVSS